MWIVNLECSKADTNSNFHRSQPTASKDISLFCRHMRIILKACSPFGSTAVDDSCYVPSATFDVIVLQGNRTDYDGLRECRRVKVFNIHQPKWAADRRKIFIRIEFHVTLDGSLRIRVGPRDTSAM